MNSWLYWQFNNQRVRINHFQLSSSEDNAACTWGTISLGKVNRISKTPGATGRLISWVNLRRPGNKDTSIFLPIFWFVQPDRHHIHFSEVKPSNLSKFISSLFFINGNLFIISMLAILEAPKSALQLQKFFYGVEESIM